MSWIVSIGVATLSGVLALIGTGFVAALAVEWYHVSSFEGASGYFVVGMAVLGLMAGCLIGLVIARIEARAAQPRFIKALGVSAATVSVILAVIAGTSWMLADIPPQIGGENLFMLVEVRWPAAGGVAPDALQSAPFLRIGATRGSVVRRLEPGVAFVEDARQEDGRWIVPGAVPVFTSRGGRVLDFGAGENIIAGFIVPLPKYPREPQRRWSPWYPVARPGDPPLPDQYAYRFRVIQRSEPVRTQTVGPFQIDTVADYFYPAGDGARMAANATFRLRHNGQPMPGITSADTVAVVGGTRTALFVTIAEPEVESRCALIVEEAGAARLQSVRGCGTPLTVRRLTSDQSVFKAAAAIDPVPGWIDRALFKEPGLFQLDSAVIGTRDLSSASFLFPADTYPNTAVPPLDLSPDERSFVWLAQTPEGQPRLGVTDWRANRSYLLPIDRARMRYNTESALDPEWVHHHFAWQRGGDGIDTLVPRPDFVPLPYHGDLFLSKPGMVQTYTLPAGGEALRTAVLELVVRELGGERLRDDPAAFNQRVRVSGKVVSVSIIGSPEYVYVSMDGDDSDPQVMRKIAATLDAALATGRYDSLFRF